MTMKIGKMLEVNEGDRVTVTLKNNDVISLTIYNIEDNVQELTLVGPTSAAFSVLHDDISMISVEPCQKTLPLQ